MFEVVDQVIIFSQQFAAEIRREADGLAKYYNNNRSGLIDSMLEIKSVDDQDDYYTNYFQDAAGKVIENIGNNKFSFKDEYLIDSYDKILKQINKIPIAHRLENPVVKVFFYDLLESPAEDTNLKIILSSMSIQWVMSLDFYQRKLN